jgi:hypothetical protein
MSRLPNSTSIPGDTNTTAANNDTGEEHEEDLDDDNKETTAATLQRMIGLQELPCWTSVNPKIQGRMHALTCAAMALDVDEQETL